MARPPMVHDGRSLHSWPASPSQNSGRSISREAEHLIERALAYDRMMDAMRTNLAEIEKGNVEAALHRLGYTPIRTAHGKLWAPPGYPGIERSGFEPWQPGEQAAGIGDEEIERRNREKLEEADKRPKWSATDALDRLSQIEESATMPAPKKDDNAA